VIPALLRLKNGGYEFVIVTNQAGLGGPSYSRAAYERSDQYLLGLFASQGIEFAGNFICPHRPEEGCACRKPGIGGVRDFVNASPLDRARSAMVGDRDLDVEFARNLGIQGLKLGAPGAETWAAIAHALVDRPRKATVRRRTRETDICVSVDLDSEAEPRAATGLGFFDHMLEQLGKHGGFRLEVQCTGDLHIDEHHTVEDVALTLGQSLREALGDKRGIQRFGFLLPMDEADAEVSIDLGGRPFLVFEGIFPRDRVGELPTELVPHFFRSLAETLGAAVHIRVRGENAHHMIEVVFKAVARALRQAFVRSGDELPTTKGQL
jgi:imidazoleglycerol-phosphate dehydratase/histidinol-phosphatase